MLNYPPSRFEVPPTAGLPLNFSDLVARPLALLADKLSQWLTIPQPIFTCSGTAALVVALRTLQKRAPHRTTIIVPAYTCPLVVLAAYHCPSLKVVACDLLVDSMDMDPEQLGRLCDETTLAIVVTHLAGSVADVASAKKIADEHSCFVIEDAAQAMGARDNNSSVGLQGDVGFFSMAVGKGLTTYEGGVLFSKEEALHKELAVTAQQTLPSSRYWEWRRCIELWGFTLCYRPAILHYVYGKPLRKSLAKGQLLEAVGDDFTSQDIPLHILGDYRQRVAANAFERLPDYLRQARARALTRVAQLKAIRGLTVITDKVDQQGVWPFIVIKFNSQPLRDQAMQLLWTRGVGVTRLFIYTVTDYPALKPFLVNDKELPVAKAFAAQTLTISNSHWLDDVTFAWIVEQLQTVLKS